MKEWKCNINFIGFTKGVIYNTTGDGALIDDQLTSRLTPHAYNTVSPNAFIEVIKIDLTNK